MKKLPKDFCEWLFDVMNIPFSKQMDWKLKHKRSPEEREYKNVNRYTRAGKSGKVIYCPACGEAEIVYDFAWAVAECPSCNTASYKNDWKY